MFGNFLNKKLGSIVADMLPKCLCMLSSQHCVPLVATYWLDSDSQSFTRKQLLTTYWEYFPTLTYHSPI